MDFAIFQRLKRTFSLAGKGDTAMVLDTKELSYLEGATEKKLKREEFERQIY